MEAANGNEQNSYEGVDQSTNTLRAVETEAERRARLERIRQQLCREPLFRDAGEAFELLIERGCESHILNGYLRRIGGYRSGNIGAIFVRGVDMKKIDRDLRKSARQFNETADLIQRLRGMWWGMYGRVAEAGCFHFPEQLREMADAVMKIDLKGYGEWNPHRESILDLLEHVKCSTGRYYYAEVSLLINACLVKRAAERGEPVPDPKYDVDSLRMMVQRQRKRYRADVAKMCTANANSKVRETEAVAESHE